MTCAETRYVLVCLLVYIIRHSLVVVYPVATGVVLLHVHTCIPIFSLSDVNVPCLRSHTKSKHISFALARLSENGNYNNLHRPDRPDIVPAERDLAESDIASRKFRR